MAWDRLKDDTVALVVSTESTVSPKVGFGYCGMKFTREPVLLTVAEIGRDIARRLCDQAQLITVQLDSVPCPEPAASSFPPPAPPPSPRTQKKPPKKKRSKRGG